MPRRYVDYLPEDGFTGLNQLSTVGALLLALSTLPFLYNVYRTATQGRTSRWTPRGAGPDRWSGPRRSACDVAPPDDGWSA